MTRLSTFFALSNAEASLDFVDIDLSKDTPLYLDPYAIQIRHDAWSERCGDHIRSFFNELLDVLRAGDTTRATHLLSHLHEPNETHLGVSSGGRADAASATIRHPYLPRPLCAVELFRRVS